jgi:hypothetical protein
MMDQDEDSLSQENIFSFRTHGEASPHEKIKGSYQGFLSPNKQASKKDDCRIIDYDSPTASIKSKSSKQSVKNKKSPHTGKNLKRSSVKLNYDG